LFLSGAINGTGYVVSPPDGVNGWMFDLEVPAAEGISLRYDGLAERISMRYVLLMIRNFKGKFAESVVHDRRVPKGFPANLAKVARRKLIMVDAATFLEALNSPPGNRLEALKGDLTGKHSIRINDQWRVVFRWTDAGPEDVEIIDYH
jgi:toxin HigB-1